MKRLIASFFAMLFIVGGIRSASFAADLENRHRLISERIVTDDEETLVLFECINSMKTEKFQGIKREPHEFCTILQHGFQPLIGALSSLSKKFKVCLKMPLTVTIKELVH